jgi:hypothetical protein
MGRSAEEVEERKAAVCIEKICSLIKKLPKSVSEATKESKIYSVFNGEEGESDHHTFNERFDAAFGADCVDESGRLKYIERGANGMDLVKSYLKSLELPGLPLDIMLLKLVRLRDGLQAFV